MAETQQDQEPPMEEILASIRKIISDDGATIEEAPKEDDILELTEEVVAEPEAAAPAEEPVPVVEMEDAEPEIVAPIPKAIPKPVFEPASIDLGDDALISQTAAAASASALSGLASMSRNNGHDIASMPIGDGSRTLEGMVLEVIKPYLKSWLDANLPTLVEKIVQKEIQKITRDL